MSQAIAIAVKVINDTTSAMMEAAAAFGALARHPGMAELARQRRQQRRIAQLERRRAHARGGSREVWEHHFD